MRKSAVDIEALPRVRLYGVKSLAEQMSFSCFMQKQNISHVQMMWRCAALVIQYGIKSKENWEKFVSLSFMY